MKEDASEHLLGAHLPPKTLPQPPLLLNWPGSTARAGQLESAVVTGNKGTENEIEVERGAEGKER